MVPCKDFLYFIVLVLIVVGELPLRCILAYVYYMLRLFTRLSHTDGCGDSLDCLKVVKLWLYSIKR